MRSLSRRKRSRSPKKSPKRGSMSPSAYLRKYQKQLMYGAAGTAGLVGAGLGGRHLYNKRQTHNKEINKTRGRHSLLMSELLKKPGLDQVNRKKPYNYYLEPNVKYNINKP